ncbi:hypothetical protein GCM10029992_54620 [Glycomyces albus]
MVTRPAPAAALLMHPKLVADLFPADLADRLARTVEFDPGAATADVSGIDRLDRVEILITGWGCPAIDPDVLDRAPRLRGIVHAAGTVKGHLHPAVFERGLAVSTAADANAVPVAEFTLSALVLAAKARSPPPATTPRARRCSSGRPPRTAACTAPWSASSAPPGSAAPSSGSWPTTASAP